MIQESGVVSVPEGAEGITIPHSLRVAPNVVEVDGAPEGSQIFTLTNQALLIIFPAQLEEAIELDWSVGYEAPVEVELEEPEPDD